MPDEEPTQQKRSRISAVVGAWTQARRAGDAEIRQLTKFGIQAGVGAALAILLIWELDRVLTRQADGMAKIAVAVEKMAEKLDEHRSDDLLTELALKMQAIQAKTPPPPKPVKLPR